VTGDAEKTQDRQTDRKLGSVRFVGAQVEMPNLIASFFYLYSLRPYSFKIL
jgi:hypothetical protein